MLLRAARDFFLTLRIVEFFVFLLLKEEFVRPVFEERVDGFIHALHQVLASYGE